MKKLKLIYNPNSGDKNFANNLDDCIKQFQHGGYETHIFRSMKYGDIDEHLKHLNHEQYDALVVSGGDGSINIVVNAIMNYNIKLPLGIIPTGTANDFATFASVPREPELAAKIIADGKTAKADVGFVSGKYFINVCAAGLWSNVSHNLDGDLKENLGKFAYYIKGIEQIPNFIPLPLIITNSKEKFEEEIYLFMVLNSSGTGGFEKLSPNAKIDDGLFDFVAIKAFKDYPIIELTKLLFKTLMNEHLSDPNVIFFRDSNIKIELAGDLHNDSFKMLDLDGERGPEMPAEIVNIKRAIDIFIP